MLALLAGGVTIACPFDALAYRTGSDLPDLANAGSVNFANGTAHVFLFSALPQSLESAQVEQAAVDAARAWTDPDCSGLTLSYDGLTHVAAVPGDGINTIQWVSDWKARKFNPEAAGLTDVQYVKTKDGWQIAEADVYLNADFSWSTNARSDTRDVQAVLTHEFGHLLGLLHPCELGGSDAAPDCSDVPGASDTTMYPIYSIGQKKLSSDDVAGLCFLYPAQGCSDSSCSDSELCGDDGACHPRCGDDWCRDGTLCDGSACRTPPKDCGSAGCVGEKCKAASDCGLHEVCEDRECVRGSAADGDPCSQPEQCSGGACVDGACASACFSAQDCASESGCDSSTHACAALKAIGEACEAPHECTGDRCFSADGKNARCTRSCGSKEPACPDGWSCGTVDGEHVCTPKANATASACSLSATPSSPSLGLTALALGFLGISRRFRVRRKS